MKKQARPPMADELNSVGLSAAARILGVSRPTVYAWIEAGRLRAYPLAGTRAPTTGKPVIRVLRADLERLRRRLADSG